MTSYGLWFSLDVEHDYYADRRCRGLDLRLDETSARVLAGHRGLARPRPGGVDVLVELDPDGDGDRPLITPAPGLALGFELWIRNPEFTLFTELSSLRALAAPTFTIAADGGVELGEGQGPTSDRLLARVDVTGVDVSWLAAPPERRVSLSSRALRWIYYYVTTADLDDKIAIIDEAPERADARIEFDAEVASASADDRVADELARTYPQRQRFRLISRAPLPCRAVPRRGLSLRSAKLTLVPELPNPSPTRVSRPTLDGVTEDVLHCILIH